MSESREPEAELRWPDPAEIWRTIRANALVSIGIGFGLVLLLALADRDVLTPRAFLSGGLVGLCIGLGAQGTGLVLLWIFRGRRRAEDNRWVPALAFFVGGSGGWLLGDTLSRLLLGFRLWPDAGWLPIVVFGLLAVAVGAVFQTTGLLRQRLEESVAELKEREFAEKELATAGAIQRRLLPPPSSEGGGYRLAAVNLPARVVAGDFYDYFRLPDGALALVVADVVGKGMGASLIMASVKAMLPLIAAERAVPAAMTELNRRLHRDLGAREFVALLLVRLDPASGAVELANAGLPDPLHLADGGGAAPVEVPGERLPLGARAGSEYRSARLELAVGHRLFCSTDGLPEALDGSGEPIGYERLGELVGRSLGVGVDDTDLVASLERLVGEVRPALGALEDDLTALVVERK